MFRAMRRSGQALSPEECDAILREGTSGVLAVIGDGGYPYAVPLSYFYEAGKLYFHCAKMGHKLDAIGNDNRVSFCVIGQDRVMPERYTTCFRSVIVFGTARILQDAEEKRRAIERLTEKYAPGREEERRREIGREFDRLCMVEISILHRTGKEAVELKKERVGR